MSSLPIIAVDVGNARIKAAAFGPVRGDGLAEPDGTLALDGRRPEWARLAPWLEGLAHGQMHWFIGSVNRPASTRLLDWIRRHRPADPVTLLCAADLPIEVRLDRPDMVGIDRLLDAVAAGQLRAKGRPAVVVDVGTAITVDLVSADGAFLGGSILPGIAMAARGMHEFTDLLPLLDMAQLSEPPPAVGADTVAAMRSGLFWGAVGAIRELVQRMADPLEGQPEVFLTGGASPAVAELLGQSARLVPHLTVAGIALAAKS